MHIRKPPERLHTQSRKRKRHALTNNIGCLRQIYMKVFADPPSCKMIQSSVNTLFYCIYKRSFNPPFKKAKRNNKCLYILPIANLPQPLPPFPVNVRTNIVMNNTKNTNDNQNSTNNSVGSTYNAIPATAAVVLAIKTPPMSPSVPPTTQYWGGATTAGEEAEPPPASFATSMRL